jgi:hypothetical protein
MSLKMEKGKIVTEGEKEMQAKTLVTYIVEGAGSTQIAAGRPPMSPLLCFVWRGWWGAPATNLI